MHYMIRCWKSGCRARLQLKEFGIKREDLAETVIDSEWDILMGSGHFCCPVHKGDPGWVELVSSTARESAPGAERL